MQGYKKVEPLIFSSIIYTKRALWITCANDKSCFLEHIPGDKSVTIYLCSLQEFVIELSKAYK